MREAVYAMFGVWLEYEMEILGEVPPEILPRLREVKPMRSSPALEGVRREFKERSTGGGSVGKGT
jgi:hypothetical protein